MKLALKPMVMWRSRSRRRCPCPLNNDFGVSSISCRECIRELGKFEPDILGFFVLAEFARKILLALTHGRLQAQLRPKQKHVGFTPGLPDLGGVIHFFAPWVNYCDRG